MKHSFFLLEILIALTLLTLVLPFLIQRPALFLKQEKKALWELQQELLYRESLNQIKLKIFQGKLPLKLAGPKQAAVHKLPAVKIELPGRLSKNIEPSFRLTINPKKTRPNPDGSSFDLAKLEICLENTKKFRPFQKRKSYLLIKTDRIKNNPSPSS
ncbi:MAG: hypothetical protein WC371_00290 [Parachlamydiales bacterium]|jgi:hypothetical protein